MRIERAIYRSGFVKRLPEAERLPAITVEAADLPNTCSRSSISASSILAATYGDLSAGDP